MRYAVVESGRSTCGVRLDIRRERLWRAAQRDTVRSIVVVGGIVELYPAESTSSFQEIGVRDWRVLVSGRYDSERAR
jgi:hypothetical protein